MELFDKQEQEKNSHK